MIAHIDGVIAEKTPTQVIVDVNGVGYEVLIPISTFEKLNKIGERQKLLTYQHVREDTLLLFGFSTKREKWMFSKLLSVSGIGPKLALGVLSGCEIDVLARSIVDGEVERLAKIPGIGRKTAQRLSLELRDKLSEVATTGDFAGPKALREEASKVEEAVMALISLGYARNAAEKTISKILSQEPGLPLDELIKRSLQNF